MAKEAREIIAYQEKYLSGGKDNARDLKLGALHIVRVAVDYAEKIGALPASLPQFSRADLTPARTEPTARTPRERVPTKLRLTPEQVASAPDQITAETRAYVGSLVHQDGQGGIVPIFEKLNSVDHISTPEGEIEVRELTIGGKDKGQLQQELKQGNFQVTSWAEEIMRSGDFETLKEPQTIRVVKMPVQALGFDKRTTPTTAQIYERADALGLDLCRAEVGPHQRFQDTDQPMNDWYWIAMKQVTDSYGYPSVFGLGRGEDGAWLGGGWASPDDRWNPGDWIVFSLRK